MNDEDYTQQSESEESTEKRKKILVEGETPIVITGGSVHIEYADQGDDGFDEDVSIPGFKKKLRHRKNPGDKAKLTRVEVTTKAGKVLMTIDLRNLDKHKDCKIKVYYDLED